MKLHELPKSKGLKQKMRRKGRWDWSKGNTSWRWNNWQKSRAGYSKKVFFEGGQTPLVKRLPKLRGFKRYYKLVDNFAVINLSSLEKDEMIKKEVTKTLLCELGYCKKNEKVKILWNWDLNKTLSFKNIDQFSKSAKEKIEKAGWNIEEMPKVEKPTKVKKVY